MRGQKRQLVAFARVLLQDPSIMILDEATDSVDSLAETQIQEGLDLVLKLSLFQLDCKINRYSLVQSHLKSKSEGFGFEMKFPSFV
jgi:ABC-type antimicrobial peptide transport system ATPase subunit